MCLVTVSFQAKWCSFEMLPVEVLPLDVPGYVDESFYRVRNVAGEVVRERIICSSHCVDTC